MDMYSKKENININVTDLKTSRAKRDDVIFTVALIRVVVSKSNRPSCFEPLWENNSCVAILFACRGST